MIAASINTAEFSQIIPDERFSVDAPDASPFIAAPSLDITRTKEGLEIYVAEKGGVIEAPSVERTLREAVARCERDLKVHPDSPRLMVNFALALMNAGNPNKATEVFYEALALEPKNYVALTMLGSLFLNRRQLEEANNAFKSANKAYPSDPAPLISLASIALMKQDFINAAEYLEKAVVLDSCSTMAKHLLGMICLRLGRHNRAINLLRATLRETGPSAELNQGIAIAYLAAGDLKRAERAFLACLAINKKMSAAWRGLAFLRIQEHRWNDAIEILSNHLDSEPEDADAREMLARAYVETGQLSRARAQLMTLLTMIESRPNLKPRLAGTCNNLGFCFGKEGKLAEAEQWLRKSLALGGAQIAAPYGNLIRVLLGQNKPQAALEIAIQADQRGIRNSDLAQLHSVALIEVDRQTEAIDVLEALVRTGTAPNGAYSDLGCLLAEWAGDYDSAAAVLKEGLERDPSDPMLLNNLAYVYLMQDQKDLAGLALEQIDEKRANPMILAATRGLLQLKLGNLLEGEALYRQAETMANKDGLRKLAISIRQKRNLEVARAHLNAGRIAEAIKNLRLGATASGGMHFYPFEIQLASMMKALASESQPSS